MNLRVHDAADDLVDDLVEKAKQTIDSLDAQIQRMLTAREAVARFVDQIKGTPTATPTPAPPPPVEERPKLAAVPAVEYHTCPVCGDVLPSARGLAVHKGLKHKTDAWVPEPITKTKVDEAKAREAAAAAL